MPAVFHGGFYCYLVEALVLQKDLNNLDLRTGLVILRRLKSLAGFSSDLSSGLSDSNINTVSK